MDSSRSNLFPKRPPVLLLYVRQEIAANLARVESNDVLGNDFNWQCVTQARVGVLIPGTSHIFDAILAGVTINTHIHVPPQPPARPYSRDVIDPLTRPYSREGHTNNFV